MKIANRGSLLALPSSNLLLQKRLCQLSNATERSSKQYIYQVYSITQGRTISCFANAIPSMKRSRAGGGKRWRRQYGTTHNSYNHGLLDQPLPSGCVNMQHCFQSRSAPPRTRTSIFHETRSFRRKKTTQVDKNSIGNEVALGQVVQQKSKRLKRTSLKPPNRMLLAEAPSTVRKSKTRGFLHHSRAIPSGDLTA